MKIYKQIGYNRLMDVTEQIDVHAKNKILDFRELWTLFLYQKIEHAGKNLKFRWNFWTFLSEKNWRA